MTTPAQHAMEPTPRAGEIATACGAAHRASLPDTTLRRARLPRVAEERTGLQAPGGGVQSAVLGWVDGIQACSHFSALVPGGRVSHSCCVQPAP